MPILNSRGGQAGICIGGSDMASLWTKEGVRLVTIAERDDWVWARAAAQCQLRGGRMQRRNDLHVPTDVLDRAWAVPRATRTATS